MEKSTGNLFIVNHDNGEKSDAYTVKEVLYWAIELIYEGYLDEDKTIEKYLEKEA